jgi:hypothetical protein
MNINVSRDLLLYSHPARKLKSHIPCQNNFSPALKINRKYIFQRDNQIIGQEYAQIMAAFIAYCFVFVAHFVAFPPV